MTLATHALIGAAIGKNFNNPLAIIGLAVMSHFMADQLRHGEYLNPNSKVSSSWWKVILDLSLGILAVYFLSYFLPAEDWRIKNIFIGTFSSIFPDLLTLLYFKLHLNFLKGIYEFHQRIHPHRHHSKEREWSFRNATNDVVLSIIAIFFFFI